MFRSSMRSSSGSFFISLSMLLILKIIKIFKKYYKSIVVMWQRMFSMAILRTAWLRRCSTSRTVPGSIPGGVTWDFFRGSFRQNHVPCRLSLRKWVPGISPGVKAAGAFGWRPTTLVVPNVEKIRGLNLPKTPRATSACRGTPLLYYVNCTYNFVMDWLYNKRR
jgi:hypothetical protein